MRQLFRILLITALFVTACRSDESMSKMLVGEWHGVSWTAGGKVLMEDPSHLTMVISKEGIYNLIIDSRVENGDWKIKSDTLFLSPESSEDVKMKIVSLSGSGLKLQVDRGRIEDIEFKK